MIVARVKDCHLTLATPTGELGKQRWSRTRPLSSLICWIGLKWVRAAGGGLVAISALKGWVRVTSPDARPSPITRLITITRLGRHQPASAGLSTMDSPSAKALGKRKAPSISSAVSSHGSDSGALGKANLASQPGTTPSTPNGVAPAVQGRITRATRSSLGGTSGAGGSGQGGESKLPSA